MKATAMWEEQRRKVRDAMPPELREIADGLKARFGARMDYLETPAFKAGNAEAMREGVTAVPTWEAGKPLGISRGKSRSMSANPTGEKAA